MKSPIQVRAGLPLTGGRLVEHARERQIPVLMSANAFALREPKGTTAAGRFRGFKKDLSALDGMDIALDSAGFTAMRLYGGYPWSIDAYMDLAAARPWTWYAAMDFCVEPEIAGDAAVRRLRLAATAVNYGRCATAARRRGIPAPIPVLQGWTVAEYMTCVDWMPVVAWPAVVAVGSMCRRPVHGKDGVLEIVAALDRVLPKQVQLHLFGVKSTALAYLAGMAVMGTDHTPPGVSRVLSVDSCAWDLAARTAFRTGRSMDIRIGFLERWLARQEEAQERCLPMPEPPLQHQEPADAMAALVTTIRNIAGERLANDVLYQVMDYEDARAMLDQSDCWGRAFAQIHGLSPATDRECIEEFLDSVWL